MIIALPVDGGHPPFTAGAQGGAHHTNAPVDF